MNTALFSELAVGHSFLPFQAIAFFPLFLID
jgi:hypothetical protein